MAEVTVDLDDLRLVMQWADPRIIQERDRGFPPIRVMQAIDRMAAQISAEGGTKPETLPIVEVLRRHVMDWGSCDHPDDCDCSHAVALRVLELRKVIVEERLAIFERVNANLVREILEALCRRDGISLDSGVNPGTPARNYELALRLGIGQVFGLSNG